MVRLAPVGTIERPVRLDAVERRQAHLPLAGGQHLAGQDEVQAARLALALEPQVPVQGRIDRQRRLGADRGAEAARPDAPHADDAADRDRRPGRQRSGRRAPRSASARSAARRAPCPGSPASPRRRRRSGGSGRRCPARLGRPAAAWVHGVRRNRGSCAINVGQPRPARSVPGRRTLTPGRTPRFCGTGPTGRGASARHSGNLHVRFRLPYRSALLVGVIGPQLRPARERRRQTALPRRDSMSAYTDHVVAALTVFDTVLSGFGALVARADAVGATAGEGAGSPDGRRQPGRRRRLAAALHRRRRRQDRRRRGRSAGPAPGRGCGARVGASAAWPTSSRSSISSARRFADALVRLDEAAQGVAAALFPSAIDGLRDVNVTLWEFEPLLWREYTGRFAEAVQSRGLTSDEQVRIQAIAGGVRQAFEDVNALLNALADNSIAGPAVGLALRAARAALGDAIAAAEKKMSPRFRDFEGVIGKAAKIAKKVDRQLGGLRIPLFPAHEDLGVLGPCIAPAFYASLSGVQRFALLNIAARLQNITVDGRHLLDPNLRRARPQGLPGSHLPGRLAGADRRHRRATRTTSTPRQPACTATRTAASRASTRRRATCRSASRGSRSAAASTSTPTSTCTATRCGTSSARCS